jgi:putative protein-disulfide isomerase
MPDTNHKPELVYVGDPMCSWCWGFVPTWNAFMTRHSDRFRYRLIVGGLRPGPAAVSMDDGMKAYLAHHWKQVESRSGQPFDLAFFERNDFVYDTEPSCRAVVTARKMAADKAFAFMDQTHEAFYARNQDPTRTDTLVEIADRLKLPAHEFRKLFESDELRRETERDFQEAREMGVVGFPSVTLVEGGSLKSVTRGWVPLEILEQALKPWAEPHT